MAVDLLSVMTEKHTAACPCDIEIARSKARLEELVSRARQQKGLMRLVEGVCRSYQADLPEVDTLHCQNAAQLAGCWGAIDAVEQLLSIHERMAGVSRWNDDDYLSLETALSRGMASLNSLFWYECGVHDVKADISELSARQTEERRFFEAAIRTSL